MAPDFDKTLGRIFFGDIPSLPSVERDVVIAAFRKQRVDITRNKFPGVAHINFVTFIRDAWQLNAASQTSFKVENIDKAKRNSGVAIRSLFNEFIQDNNLDDLEKLNLTFFLRNVLSNFADIYQIEIIDNQFDFVQRLLRLEDFYAKRIQDLVKIYVKEERAKHQKIANKFELSRDWPYSKLVLAHMCRELMNEKFIESELSFKLVFDRNSSYHKCNWLKPRTSLQYFLWLLLDKGSETISQGTVSLLCNRFYVQGKETSMQVTKATNYKIKRYLDMPHSKLTRCYAQIFTIWRNTIK